MGDAYRASDRAAPLFDSVGHHPYGTNSSERPWHQHSGSLTIGLGDWKSLMQALHDGFAGTPQALPGTAGPQIWYLESGFQTVPAADKAALYSGIETDKASLPDHAPHGDVTPLAPRAPDQATQLADAVHLAYCQPYVAVLLNFLLYDETDLNRWQSGLYWADGTEKLSAQAFRTAAAAAAASKIRCSALKNGPADRVFVPKTTVDVTRIGWSRSTRYNHKHDLWRTHVRIDESANYTAVIVPVRRRSASARAIGEPAATTQGRLRAGFYSWVKFPRERLAPGLYRIEIAVTSERNPQRVATLDGPVFRVMSKR